jgi:hypothetical protein
MDAETESEARKEALAAEADDRIKRGAHWDDWCFVADGFAVGRNKAMRRAGTNQPVGSAYNRAFGDWMAERSWAKNTDKATRNHLLWVADHRSEIEAWRATLSRSERDRINHPTTLRRKWDAAHRPNAADHKSPKKETKAEALQRENAELWDKVKRMERDGGSLFDLNQTPLKDIAKIMGEHMGLGRLTRLQQEIGKEIAALKDKLKAQAG